MNRPILTLVRHKLCLMYLILRCIVERLSPKRGTQERSVSWKIHPLPMALLIKISTTSYLLRNYFTFFIILLELRTPTQILSCLPREVTVANTWLGPSRRIPTSWPRSGRSWSLHPEVQNQKILHFKHLQTLTVKALQTLVNKSEFAWQSWCQMHRISSN